MELDSGTDLSTSMAAVVLLALACAQAVYCAPSGCGPFFTGPVVSPPVIDIGCPGVPEYPSYTGCYDYPGYGYPGYYDYPGYGYPGYYDYPGYGYPGYSGYPGYGYPGCSGYPGYPGFEVGCCPGAVVEEETVVQKPVTIPYYYSEPTYSKQCYQRGTVSREVIPGSYETTPVCETLEQVTKLPTTDITTTEQPLCKTTCTVSEYLIQIPIVEKVCTSAPLCKKSIRAQDNLLTTVSKKTACAKEVCTQNKVIERPVTETVCQNYQGAITRSGAQTVYKPEVVKSCVQLPPYKCLKPAPGPILYEDGYGFGGYGGVEFVGDYPGYGVVEAGYPYADYNLGYGGVGVIDYLPTPAYPGCGVEVGYPALYPGYGVDVGYPGPGYPGPGYPGPGCACFA